MREGKPIRHSAFSHPGVRNPAVEYRIGGHGARAPGGDETPPASKATASRPPPTRRTTHATGTWLLERMDGRSRTDSPRTRKPTWDPPVTRKCSKARRAAVVRLSSSLRSNRGPDHAATSWGRPPELLSDAPTAPDVVRRTAAKAPSRAVPTYSGLWQHFGTADPPRPSGLQGQPSVLVASYARGTAHGGYSNLASSSLRARDLADVGDWGARSRDAGAIYLCRGGLVTATESRTWWRPANGGSVYVDASTGWVIRSPRGYQIGRPPTRSARTAGGEDLDGDARPDIVVATGPAQNNTLSVLRHNGRGTFGGRPELLRSGSAQRGGG